MAKKSLRVLSFALAIVLVASLFVGCSLFQLNEERYRGEEVIKVGDVSITVGDFIDFYANTMSNYIQQGNDVQEVWDNVGNQLLLNFIVYDTIKKQAAANNWTGVAQNAPYNTIAANYEESTYLQKANDFEVLLKNVRLSLYDSLNTLVETELGNTYTIAEVEEETERKINVLDEYNIYVGALTASDFDDDIDKLNEDLSIYRDCDLGSLQSIVDTYIFEEESDLLEAATAKINKRVTQEEGVEEDDEDFVKISELEYIEAQRAAMNSLTRTIRTNYYGWKMADFLAYQLKSAVLSRLVQQYAIKEYTTIETDAITKLGQKLANLKQAKIDYYNLHPTAFITDITSLSEASYIYTVPQQYENKFAFVKNLLFQFSEEQTEQLAAYKRFGTTSSIYLDYRKSLVEGLVATDYTSELNADDEYSVKIENIFSVEGDTVVFSDTALKTGLESMTATTNMLQRNIDFDRLIDKYNEDPGMQGKTYDYVLRVDEPDAAGTPDSWVSEFSEAGRKAVANGVGSYEIAVTDYGVHVVYFSGYVVADTFDFSDNTQLYTTNTATYRFFREYYDAVKDSIYDDNFNAIIDSYFNDKKISINKKPLKKLLENYGFEIKWNLD